MAVLIALGPPISSRDCFSPTPSELEAASRHFGIGEKQSRLDAHELRPRNTVFRNRPPFSQGAVEVLKVLSHAEHHWARPRSGGPVGRVRSEAWFDDTLSFDLELPKSKSSS